MQMTLHFEQSRTPKDDLREVDDDPTGTRFDVKCDDCASQ